MGFGACRPVDVDGVGSEDLRVLPGGLAVGVAVDGVGSEDLRVLGGGLAVGVTKVVGVGTDVVLVLRLTGLEDLLPAGVEAGVEAGVVAGVEAADTLALLAAEGAFELGTSAAGSKNAESS